MATLKDVAKLACVDVSTVSRALNNTSYVHPDTKKKVLAAVKQLSYQPNVLAQGLRQGKRHTLGVVVPHIQLSAFADVLHGIEQEARRFGYSTLICNTGDDAKVEKECLNRLRNGFVDALIVAPTGQNNRLLRDIYASGISVVQVVRRQDTSLSSVVADYDAAGYEGVRYLVRKGCREIGLINGSMKLAPYRERYNGYHRAMGEYGLLETTADLHEPVNTFEYGYLCTKELLAQNPELDSILAAVDIQGMGAIRALKDAGIAVPDQIRLLSLTGHSIGTVLETTMTSMEIPAREIGEKATRMAIESIEAEPESRPGVQHLTFAASLIERETG